ncbi:hypothetical protein SBA4_2330018 [Candidatus Sulfopaludibacter sp. SbA4]|nr:hypothetical protein SBA4_2330018 [Candidatus Sulfopaludibacter sp. SbA4]
MEKLWISRAGAGVVAAGPVAKRAVLAGRLLIEAPFGRRTQFVSPRKYRTLRGKELASFGDTNCVAAGPG